jgi:hypothetical protein
MFERRIFVRQERTITYGNKRVGENGKVTEKPDDGIYYIRTTIGNEQIELYYYSEPCSGGAYDKKNAFEFIFIHSG